MRELAANAGALILTAVRTKFGYNQKPNRVALHDQGQAACQLSLQAVEESLQVHQMAGVNLSRITMEYGIPEDFVPQTAIVIGYPDLSPPSGEEQSELHKRDTGTRTPLPEQVFAGKWGSPASFLDG